MMGPHFPPRDIPRKAPPSEDAGFQSGPSKKARPLEFCHVRDGWMGLPQTTQFVDGMALYSATVALAPGGCRVMLKATRRGSYWVSFVNGATWIEALETTLEWAEKGVLTWRVDKYPPK